MTIPTQQLTYGTVGRREDLSDTIYDLLPQDFYCLTQLTKTTATNTLHEWQTQSKDAVNTSNAAPEGEDFAGASASQPTRLGNYLQISRKEVTVSGTTNASNLAGRQKEMTRQALIKGIALKSDMESILLQNQVATAGAAASARLLAGMEAWIYASNNVRNSASTTQTTYPPSSGLCKTAIVDGTAYTYTEAFLKTALQVAWENGGQTDTILTGAYQKGVSDTFTGQATRYRDVASRSQAQIIGAADVYVSSYGSHTIKLSRYMRASTVFCLDSSTWAVSFMPGRNMKIIDIAPTGDSEKKMWLSEYTLEARAPLANTKLATLTTS